MYVILVNNDDTLLTTRRERIMQRSKLFNDLWFLVNPNYNGYNMADCTVLLEYTLPVSRRYCSEILVLSEEMYENHLKYLLPIDTNLTAEAGEIELQLSFIYSDLDTNGRSVQRVRKTIGTSVNVTPIKAWSDIIPDSALTALDQRIIKTDAQIKALDEMNTILMNTKADNLKYNEENNELQLMSGNKEIGDKVVINATGESIKDGIPVVDFSDITADDEHDTPDLEDNVVEF